MTVNDERHVFCHVERASASTRLIDSSSEVSAFGDAHPQRSLLY